MYLKQSLQYSDISSRYLANSFAAVLSTLCLLQGLLIEGDIKLAVSLSGFEPLETLDA